MDKLTGEWKNLYNGTATRFSYSPNVKNPEADNITALHILVAASVKKGADKESVLSILDIALSVDGVDVNVQDADGKTPLYWAVELGSFGAFERLLKKGAKVNIDFSRHSPEFDNLLQGASRMLLEEETPDRLKIFQRLLEITNELERNSVLESYYYRLPEAAKALADPYLPSKNKKWIIAQLKMKFATFIKERIINNRLDAVQNIIDIIKAKLALIPLNKDIFDTNQLEAQSKPLEDEYIAFLDRIIEEFNRMPKPNKSNVGLRPTFYEFWHAIQDILQFITAKQQRYLSTYKQLTNLPPIEENFDLFLGQVLHLMNAWLKFDDIGVTYNINLNAFFQNPESFISYEVTKMRDFWIQGLAKKKLELQKSLQSLEEERKREREAKLAAERQMEEVRKANAARREAEAEAARKQEALRLAKLKEEADKKAAKNAQNKKDREAAEAKARRNAEERARLAEEAKRAREAAAKKQAEEAEKIRAAKEALKQAEELQRAREQKAREDAEREAAERIAREEQERLDREVAERLAREEQERIAREAAERFVREEQERLGREEAERIAREGTERGPGEAPGKPKKAAENASLKAVNEQLQILYNAEGEHIEALVGLREVIRGQFNAYDEYERTKNRETARGMQEVNDLETQLNESLREFREMRVNCVELNDSIATLYKQQQAAQTLLWRGSLASGISLKQKIIYKEKNLKYRNYLINLVTDFINKAALCYGIDVEYWRKILTKDTKAREIEQADLQELKRQSPEPIVNPVPKPNESLRDVLTLIDELLAEIGKRNELDNLQKKTALENSITEILRRRHTLDARLNFDESYIQIILHLNELENLQSQILSVLTNQKNAENFRALPKREQVQRKKIKMLRTAIDFFATIEGTTIEEPKQEEPKPREVVPPPPPPPVVRRTFSEIRTELEETDDPYRAVELINEAIVTNGYNINEINEEGHTLLMLMVVKRFSKAVKRLLDLGANANLQDPKGFTALMMSLIVVNPNNIFESGTLITITNLIDKSDVNLLDKNGYDAYHFAEELENRIIPRNEKETFTQKVLNVLNSKRSFAPVRGIRSLLGRFFGGTKKKQKHAAKKSLKRHGSK